MATDTPPDADLVHRCLQGEESAWEALASRYADVVYGVAWRSGLRGDDAGDVVQEVFIALLGHLGRLRRTDRLLPWILTTAKREAWRQVRRRRAAGARERDHARPEAASEPLPDGALAQLEEEQAVRAAFGRLTERCRRLLDALFFRGDGRAYTEVAEELGVPVGSLGPTRRRCLDALQRELAKEGFPPPEDVSGEGPEASRGVKRKRP